MDMLFMHRVDNSCIERTSWW